MTRGNDCGVTNHRAVRRESNLITNHFKSKRKEQPEEKEGNTKRCEENSNNTNQITQHSRQQVGNTIQKTQHTNKEKRKEENKIKKGKKLNCKQDCNGAQTELTSVGMVSRGEKKHRTGEAWGTKRKRKTRSSKSNKSKY